MDCARCQTWTQLREPLVDVVLHRNAAELADGARHGCWWCVRILTHLQRKLKSLPDSLQGCPSDVTCTTESMGSFEFRSFARLQMSSSDYWYSRSRFEIDGKRGIAEDLPFFTKKPSPLNHILYDRGTLPENTNSQGTWEYIIACLENCQNNHEVCQQPPGGLPSRLVEVREEDGKLHFRLIITPSSGPRDQYITLSHRWGVDTPLKLTSETLSNFMTEIPRQEMPQKYIDAAVIALRLNIRHLWIDSLVSSPPVVYRFHFI